jgi:hypothetical protein
VTLADLEEARALYAQLDPAWFDEANDPDAWLSEPAVQQIIDQIVDDEIAAWKHLLSPEGLQMLREELVLACHTDAVTIEYLRRIRPQEDRDGSGKVKKNKIRRPNVVPLPRGKAGGERS